MAENEQLKNMILGFRVSELQMLLGFAGRNKSGRKNELQMRAIELLQLKSDSIRLKIKDLYNSIQQVQSQSSSTLSGVPISQPGPMPSTSHSSQQNSNNHIGYDTRLNMARATQAAVAASAPAVQTRQMHQEQAVARQPIYSNMYYPGYKPSTPGCLPPADVRIKRLPFYDIMGELVQPSILTSQELFTNLVKRSQETMVSFNLNSEQASELSSSRDIRPGTKIDFQVQVQLRLCVVDPSREQDDAFPPGLNIKVNGKPVPLPNPVPTNKPNVEPRRPPRALNITPLIKISPVVTNNLQWLQICWTSEPDRHYATVIYLVRKLSSMDLLSRLKTRGSRHTDYTRGLIKEKLSEDADCDIATTSLRVSLTCPLGKMRMSTPCRASTCNHLQCFDAMTYLQMNERKPTWMCPVCDKSAIYDNLTIDGYFQQVLESVKSANCSDIQLNQDGTWSPLIEKKKGSQQASEHQDTKSGKNDSDDLVVISPIKKMEPSTPVPVNGKIAHAPSTSPPQSTNGEESLKRKAVTVVDLTFSSDEEDEAPNRRMISSSSGANKHDKIPPNSISDSSGSVTSSSSVLLSGGSTRSAPTPASVTSSGYVSPSIITLDSPSPPATPQQIPTGPGMNPTMPASTNYPLYNHSLNFDFDFPLLY